MLRYRQGNYITASLLERIEQRAITLSDASTQILAQRFLLYQNFSGTNTTIYEVRGIHHSMVFKSDKAIRWCFNAKDIRKQINPKGLRLAPLISSAFPPLCKFSGSHSHLPLASSVTTRPFVQARWLSLPRPLFFCLHIACLGFSIMGTKLLYFIEYSASNIQKMLIFRAI